MFGGGGGGRVQHGGLAQWIGWHSILGLGQQGGIFFALPTRAAPAITTINTTNLNNIFKRIFIFTNPNF